MGKFGDKDYYVVRYNADAADAVDRCIWTCPADQSYRLSAISEVHSTVGGASAAVRPRKVTGTSAPGAAAGATVIEQSAAIDLTATVNTVVRPSLTGTEAQRTFLPGDRLCLDFSGTVSGLVGMNLEFSFEPVGRYL
jgi:hypothetical protein